MLILTLLDGDQASRQFTVQGDQPQVIGRHGPGIRLSDSRVSRRHAMIQRDGERWLLIDLGSSNGTYVNDQRIPGPADLKTGDRIRMGRLLLEVTIQTQAQTPTPTQDPIEEIPAPSAEPPAVPASDAPLRLDLPFEDEDEAPRASQAPQTMEQEHPSSADEVEAEVEDEDEDEALWESDGPIESAILPPDEAPAVEDEGDIDMPAEDVDVDIDVDVDVDVDAGIPADVGVDVEDLVEGDEPGDASPARDDQAAQLRQWVQENAQASASPAEFIDIAPAPELPDVPDEDAEADRQEMCEAHEVDASDVPSEDEMLQPPADEVDDEAEDADDVHVESEADLASAPLPIEAIEAEALADGAVPEEARVERKDEPAVDEAPAPAEARPVVKVPSEAMVPGSPPRRRPTVLLLGLLMLGGISVGLWYVYPLLPFSLAQPWGESPDSIHADASAAQAFPAHVQTQASPEARSTLKTLQASEAATASPTRVADPLFDDGPEVIGRAALAGRSSAGRSVPSAKQPGVPPVSPAPAVAPTPAVAPEHQPVMTRAIPSLDAPAAKVLDTSAVAPVEPSAPEPERQVKASPAPQIQPPTQVQAKQPAVSAASRTAYLVDASGSLIDTFSQVVDYLSQQIRQLPGDHQFTVIFFRQGDLLEVPPAGWKPADRQSVNQALRWMTAESGHVWPQGRSNVVGALTRALAYHPTDICIYSDNAMHRRTSESNPQAVLQAIDAVLSQVPLDELPRIHTVQFVYEDPNDVLHQVAQRYGGQFQFISPDPSAQGMKHPLQTLMQTAQ